MEDKHKTVSQLMVKTPVFCGTLDSVAECARIMYDENVGFLGVLDENDRLTGVVTDRDLVCGCLAQGLDVKSTPVPLVMERNFRIVGPTDGIDMAVRIMREEGVRRLVVLEGNTCVGVLALDDLIIHKAISRDDLALIVQKQMSQPSARRSPLAA